MAGLRVTKTTTVHLTDSQIQVGALIDVLSTVDRSSMISFDQIAPDRPGSVARYSLTIREETPR